MEVQINGSGELLEVGINGPLAFPFTSTAYGSLNADLIAALSANQPVAIDLSQAELPDTDSAKHLLDLHNRFEDAHTPLGLCSVPAPLQATLIAFGLPESAFHPSVGEFTFSTAN